MIAYPIQAALESKLFSAVIVSTDCVEIRKIALAYGAETPFLRPPELADDWTPTIPVIRHAIGEYQRQQAWPANLLAQLDVCCIYPTAPMLRGADLRAGHEALLAERGKPSAAEGEPAAAFAFSVTTYAYPIHRALIRDERSGRVQMLDEATEVSRSQDLAECWHDAGQYYWGSAAAWCTSDKVLGPSSIGVPLDRYRVQDIDTLADWRQAELMYRALELAESRSARVAAA